MNKISYYYNLIFFKDFYLSILWLVILLGININVSYLNISNNENLLEWTYSMRGYVQFVILIFLIYKNFFIFSDLRNVNNFFILFFLYNLVQIYSLILSDNDNYNIIYNILALNILLFFNIIFIKKKKEVQKILYFFILLIAFIYLSFLIEYLYNLIIKDHLFYGHHSSKSSLMPVMNMPRSSGLGRMALLIFLFFVIFVDLNKIKNKLFLIFLVIPGIFLTQSRAIVGVYILVLLVISFSKYFKLYNLQFNDFKKNLVMFIIVPLITSILITQLKTSNLNYYKSLYFKMINDSENFKLNKVEKELKFLRNQNPSFSSYRITHWKDIIKKTKSTQSVLIGNGTQADRFLIKQTASNATLYFYASTGVIGLLIYAMIIINIVKILLKKINYLKKSSHKDNKFTFAVLIIFVFLIRGLVESSYAVFSIDYIFFIIALYYINYDTKTQS
jgi:hypothetical protein